MQELVSFCKRRGFVFQSSEIYGGFSAVYDYGHYGILLKDNIKKAWWKAMVQKQTNIKGLDSGIFMHPKVWEASGHISSFDDPQIDCRECNFRMRADHVLESFGIDLDKAPIEEVNMALDKLKAENKLKCNNCGSADLTEAKRFSLMVKSNLGSPTDELSEDNVVYLRPETCGGIYVNYKNMLDSTRVKLPFGIAQVGKAFRNEIIARQFIFRTREFEQMEMQYFLHPDLMDSEYTKWQSIRLDWYLEYGVSKDSLRWHEHKKLAHYASKAYDVEYNFKSLGGFKEVEGIHARGNFDLTQHGKFSKTKLEYIDPMRNNERYIPHVLETSVGLNRLFFMFLDSAYTEETFTDENGKEDSRVVLKLDKRLAPIKYAVLPLMKKDGLGDKAKEIFSQLSENYMCEYDEAGSIGKRYRRQDEIGTPECITIDYDTLKDGTVTLRDRDTMQQKRVNLSELIK